MFYLTVLSNKPNALYTVMMNYEFKANELLQALSMACYGGFTH